MMVFCIKSSKRKTYVGKFSVQKIKKIILGRGCEGSPEMERDETPLKL